jgi:hypothetical protein
VSAAVTFTVDTTSPTVTLIQPKSPSNKTTPSFSGTASDTSAVTVNIYAGATATGPVVSTAGATGTGGSWSSGNASPALTDGEHTAVATQPSSLGNPPGVSAPVTFKVDTKSPTVTLNQPKSPSNNTTPSFTGTASDTTMVTVQIYAGATATGLPVSTATAPGSGGTWASDNASPTLKDGEYTAVATQPSSLGNHEGKSLPVTFTVDTAAPRVTLNSPASPSNNTSPSFSGSASDTTAITVQIYAGASATGAVVSTATAPGTGGTWASGNASPVLSSGEYTAVATQPSSLGNPSGVSAEVTFKVDTTSPTVTLNQPKSPSNKTTPAFTGTASDVTPVTVKIYAGASATGAVVSTATAPGSGGTWASGNASPGLSSGEYTAVATQPSSLGNPEGKSSPVTFTVDTAAPRVTLNPPKSPSNNTTPSFTGSASDATEVTVQIYAGATATGTEVSKATATPGGGQWSSNNASPPLQSGQYTAVATQPSSLGNPAGVSSPVTFTVDTTSPTVTLNPPKSPSNDTTPSFSGSASDTTPVTVRIYEGTTTEGPEVSTAKETTRVGNSWTSASASPGLSIGKHTYTAVATQPSSLGNPSGVSAAVTFTVDTTSPIVTLKQPGSPSKNTTPSFSGTASDTSAVTVNIYAGATATGPVVSTAGATGTGGSWSSGNASPGLPSGEYTAVATQPSSLGNPPGVSAPVTFKVDTKSPTVTLNQPKSPSNNATPSFTGTASDTTMVTVQIYAGATATGLPVSTATAVGTGGGWTSGNASPALLDGQYTAVATQPSSLENPAGVSGPVTFTVDTAAPRVTLNSPALRSNNTTPSFTGTASDTTTVTVQIYAGASATGTAVRTVTAPGTGGSWSSSAVSPELSNGEYTAVATQPSSLGNPPGVSSPVTFKVDTTSPTVTLNQPKSPSNNTTPSFTGTASDITTVTVRIYTGATAKGTAVRTVTAAGTGGSWSSAAVSPALLNGEYTATATQTSSLKNPAGVSSPVTFTVDTTSPIVTLKQPVSPSKNTTPSFTGTASDTTLVNVDIYAGTKAAGSPVSTATATPTGGSWTSGAVSPALPNGEYTAVATQTSSLGNPAGVSSPVSFKVDTTSPTVTLNPPKSPSNNTSPSFSGSASDTTPVTVKIYEGATTAGPEVSTAKETTRVGSSWTSGSASPGLSIGKHTYTAVATQASSLGNPAGVSAAATFTVDTTSPTVTLNQPVSRSNDIKPSFTGTASDTSTVIVTIYEVKGGKEIFSSQAKATPSGGSWTSLEASPALPEGKHTYIATATQASSLGNPAGVSNSVTFTVDTEAPSVTVNAPASRSNNPTPSFTGTTDEASEVIVHIYNASNLEVSTATAPGTGGSWTSSKASPALPDGQYAATATQESLFGNHIGETPSVSFTVDTAPPQVAVTYPSDGSSTTSDFQLVRGSAGTAVDDLPGVTVQLFSGSAIVGGQAPVQSIRLEAAAGAWSATLAGLSPGTYTARAVQSDDVGNVGVSNTTTFVVTGPARAATAHPPPTASFAWFPTAPYTGEPVSLASGSTDALSPITAFAWDLAGNGAFAAGGQVISTTFSTPGNHVVQLRVTDASGLSSVAAAAITVTSPPPTLMQPFPIVRIASTDTASGVKLRLLRVQAPAGARIAVACKGHGCPVKSQSRVAAAGKAGVASVEFRRFQRSLRAGVTLEIRVSKAGEIGKYTRFLVRRGKLPVRVDTCLSPVGVNPMACPSS